MYMYFLQDAMHHQFSSDAQGFERRAATCSAGDQPRVNGVLDDSSIKISATPVLPEHPS